MTIVTFSHFLGYI